jgi:hypothetical protein
MTTWTTIYYKGTPVGQILMLGGELLTMLKQVKA